MSISEFHGQRFADVRLWVEPRDRPGALLIPTRKGLSVPLEFMAELVEAIDVLAKATRRGGRAA